jgi:hypothetical protein
MRRFDLPEGHEAYPRLRPTHSNHAGARSDLRREAPELNEYGQTPAQEREARGWAAVLIMMPLAGALGGGALWWWQDLGYEPVAGVVLAAALFWSPLAWIWRWSRR